MQKVRRDDITPEPVFLNRRQFLRSSIWAGTTLATAGLYRHFRPARLTPTLVTSAGAAGPLTPLESVTHYNNFYEFSTDKEDVAERAAAWAPGPWRVAVDGLVERPRTFDLGQMLSAWPSEERIYRLRCVEGWSMVIPWQGFPLARVLETVKPLSAAKYVAFTSFYDPKVMPDGKKAGLPFPYVEGLRLDEAMHPLTLLATGLYGKPLPNQNGAPVRLVVPWKYGFKSAKSIVRIELVADLPPTTWNLANADEYGFYSNVNPAVDHPRWSQAHERRIGESTLRATEMLNGYGEVASLYAGMDLRRNF